MSSLTLITGTIDEAEDPFYRLNIPELYYEKWEEDEDEPGTLIISREPVPIRFYGQDKFKITQFLGSGKTLIAMHILSEKVFYGGRVCANLGLVWDNEGKKKDEWISSIQTLEDFKTLEHCTAVLDDIKGTVAKWNVKESDVVSEVANAGRKMGLDLIVTAQREKMIPPELRDIATEWIVPIIRVRDFTRPTPDNTGYPIEMICLHFDGSKTFKYMSEPIIGLEPLFEAYSTTQRAIALRAGDGGARPNQPGYALEAKAFEFLKANIPDPTWQHLNGKNVFDIVSDTRAIDVTGTDPDGYLYLDHKDLLKHIRTAERICKKPYLMFQAAGEWRFVGINHNLNEFVSGKKVNPDKIYKNRIRTVQKI